MTDKVSISIAKVCEAVLTAEESAQIAEINLRLNNFGVQLAAVALSAEEIEDAAPAPEEPARRKPGPKPGRKAKRLGRKPGPKPGRKAKKAKGPGRGRWGKRAKKVEAEVVAKAPRAKKAKRKYTRRAKAEAPAAEAAPVVAPRGRVAVPTAPAAAAAEAKAPGEG